MKRIKAAFRVHKAGYALSIVIVAALLGGFAGTALAQPDPILMNATQQRPAPDEVLAQDAAGTLKILPNPAYVDIGGSVTVDIWLEDVGNIYGLDFKLNFEKAKVSIPSGNATPLWEVFTPINPTDPEPFKNSVANLDETYDQLWYAVYNLNPAEPFTGTGRLCSITFSGLVEGTTALDFTYVLASTREGDKLYPIQMDGSIFVTQEIFTATLTAGWNLVSFPLAAPTDSPRDLLASVAASYDLVYAWNGATQSWESFLQPLPDPQTLSSLDLTEGFWIHMLAEDELRIGGSLPVATSVSLDPGWNLVGFPASAPRAVETALSPIAGKFTLLYEYDASASANPWGRYDPNAPIWASTLTTLKPGMGYWIKATEACTWTVPY
jgi:hypothetical protein